VIHASVVHELRSEDPAGRDEQFFAHCRDEIKACLLRSIERL